MLDVGKVVMIELETSAQLKRFNRAHHRDGFFFIVLHPHNVCKIVSYCHHEAIQFIAWPS